MEKISTLFFLAFLFVLPVGMIRPSFFTPIKFGTRKRVLLLSAILFAATVIFSPAPSPEQEKNQPLTKTASPTSAEKKVATQAPTVEPQKSNDKDVFSATDKSYLMTVSLIIQRHAKTLKSLGEFLQEKPLPILWTNEETIKVAAWTVILEQGVSSVVDLEHTEKLNELHDEVVAGFYLHADAMKDLRKGIDSLDAEDIESASDKLNKGSGLISSATELLSELMVNNE